MMLTSNNFKTITQLRIKTLEIIQVVREHKNPVYIISHSKPQAVIISIEEYGSLLEQEKENNQLKELVKKYRTSENC